MGSHRPSLSPPRSFLELAHGPGHLLLRMARQGLRPVGLGSLPRTDGGVGDRGVSIRAGFLPTCGPAPE
ncbi:MAG: hypothetical protein RMK65_07230 [Anaerolineae bacterium]|nr:hypothetical protein [Anaerolineae bacterium]